MLFPIWERKDWKKKLRELCNGTELVTAGKELFISALYYVYLPFLKLSKFVIFVVHISFQFFNSK